jgi:extradiol dioxygenase family protein
LPSDGEDRELDINGSMEAILEKVNDTMFEATKANKGSGGVGKKYRYDYRKDGKLDITFIRTKKNWKELKDKSVNTQMGHYFNQVGGFNNKKKTYFLWTDVDMGNVSVPHFGVHLSRENFNSLKKRLTDNNTKYYDEPYLRFKGTKYEQETFFVKDPNENILEIKTLTANPE